MTPQDIQKCACPSIDPRLCILMRYGPAVEGEHVDTCECPCHQEWAERANRDTEDWLSLPTCPEES